MADLFNAPIPFKPPEAMTPAVSPPKYIDLTQSGVRTALQKRILADIDQACQELYDDGPRTHLGASLTGNDCMRYLQYNFRWMDYFVHEGRMQRLFNRGHATEARFETWLKHIGFNVWLYEDPNGEKQFRCSAVNGHFGGSLDGQNKPPERYCIDPNETFLCEFKTSKTGSPFNKLTELGVQAAKYQHYIQMCIYGRFYNLRYALYMCINKNDDDIYVEIVPLDWKLAEEAVRKADRVINETVRLFPRYSESPTHYICKICDFHGICHNGNAAARNCRSCAKSSAVANGEWFCSLYNGNIPKDFIAKGCPSWHEFGK